MSTPIINKTTSVLGFRQGDAIEYQPYATNSPTSWLITGLPDGLTYHVATGKISGSCLHPGVHLITLQAINADGMSDPLVVPIGVEPGLLTYSTIVDLSVDVETGKVWPTQSFQDFAAVGKAWRVVDPAFYAKEGDQYLIGVRYFREKDYMDLSISAIRISVKNIEPDTALVTGGGDSAGEHFLKVGTGRQSMWIVPLNFSGPALAGALSEYEADHGTRFMGLGEIEWVQDSGWTGLPGYETVRQSSRTFVVSVERGLVAG